MFIVSPEPEVAPQVKVNYFSIISSSEKAFLRHHPVESGELTQGEYIDPNDLVAELTRGRKPKSAFMPENVLAETDSLLVFYEPSHTKHPIYYKSSRKKGERIARPIRVAYPSMLYVVDRKKRSLRLGMLRYNRRPRLTDTVYDFPLPNVSGNGSVCLGSVKLPEILDRETVGDISEAYLNSVKTHLNSQTMFRKGKTTEDRWYAYVADLEKKQSKFRVSDFTMAGTVKQWVGGAL